MSLTQLPFYIGSAMREGRRSRFSLVMPRTCRRSLVFSAEAEFFAIGGLPAQTSTADYRVPCPRTKG